MSEISHRFELGDSTILAGTSGAELARRVLEQAGGARTRPQGILCVLTQIRNTISLQLIYTTAL